MFQRVILRTPQNDRELHYATFRMAGEVFFPCHSSSCTAKRDSPARHYSNPFARIPK